MFVSGADFDVEEPYITVCEDLTGDEYKLLVPKSLAYYLSTHFCGSNVMRELIQEHTRADIAGFSVGTGDCGCESSPDVGW